jgi:hypothetical protein
VVVGFRASRVRTECASAPREDPILPPGQTGQSDYLNEQP